MLSHLVELGIKTKHFVEIVFKMGREGDQTPFIGVFSFSD